MVTFQKSNNTIKQKQSYNEIQTVDIYHGSITPWWKVHRDCTSPIYLKFLVPGMLMASSYQLPIIEATQLKWKPIISSLQFPHWIFLNFRDFDISRSSCIMQRITETGGCSKLRSLTGIRPLAEWCRSSADLNGHTRSADWFDWPHSQTRFDSLRVMLR